MQLWREISAHGSPGSYRRVARLTGYLRRQEQRGQPLPHAPPSLTPTEAVGILVRRPADRIAAEQHTIDCMTSMHLDVGHTARCFETIAQLLRHQAVEDARQQLDHWMATAEASEIPELTASLTKLRQDVAAVAAALELPYSHSQGQTEGQINWLKLIKHAIYGRAKFDLLRQRVLYAAAN
jgi:hypothetical protein